MREENFLPCNLLGIPDVTEVEWAARNHSEAMGSRVTARKLTMQKVDFT